MAPDVPHADAAPARGRARWHRWEFDVRTGQSYCELRQMRGFDVSVEPGAPTRIGVCEVELDGNYVALIV